MAEISNILINNSILYRCTQKYYDKKLSKYNIGYGQVLFLMMIYENEGITMKELSRLGSFDKGTTTKGISKLEKNGYIRLEVDPRDKRSKLLYTTEKAKDIIANIYFVRSEWWDLLTQDLEVDESDAFEGLMKKVVDNALEAALSEETKAHFYGMQKLTLLDYPGKIACTLFTGGCNMRCPFCQNSDLVFLPENTVEIPERVIDDFLEKRKGLLEGVCISGGEPLLQEGIKRNLRKYKDMGYYVKVDTNGTFPERLMDIVEEGLVDYVAMDVKNAPDKYAMTAGNTAINMDNIRKSVAYLKEGHVPYEFRTTIVKEFHTEEDIRAIGAWLEGADAYYLQNFEDNEKVIQSGLHAWDYETLKRYQDILHSYIKNVDIRGIDQ